MVPRGSNLLRLRQASERPTAISRVDGDAKADAETPRAETGRAAPASDDTGYDSDDAPWPEEAAGVGLLDDDAPVAAPAASGAAVRAGRPAKTESTGALPKLEALKARLGPAETAALEELFRARFVSVKRIPEGWLKP
ncbi:hypothetical protein [Nibricoccus sp. IMCC34717]|uniref:hypothetical protein n=1 Tax=Nibricoccus sp. IMCC34717 TaxID=3034021 RepID=UPI00384EF9DC